MTLRPLISFLSFYWGTFIHEDPKSLRWNLMFAHAFSLLPFLFVPLFPTIGYLIFASAMFTLFYRAETPALMEIIRRNLDKTSREASFSFATTAGYIEGIILALFTGWMVENLTSGWVLLFPAYASIGLISLYFQKRLEIQPIEEKIETIKKSFSFLEPILTGLSLLKNNPQFLRFQLGYFLCGGGLMLAMPAIAVLLTGLGFGFTTLFASNCAVKEVGMILATPLWGYFMKKSRYELLSGVVFVFVASFLGVLFFLEWSSLFLFVAYFLYGIAQAGSHLIWNLSGPYFSKDAESSRYTMVNVFMVGVRGSIMPLLGGWMTDVVGPKDPIFYGILLSIAGALMVLRPQSQEKRETAFI
jgi:predicted MFS family arabinose efflux permease